MTENGARYETRKLSTKQVKAIAALLSERTIGEAASRSGVSQRTLTRWLSESGFQSELREAETKLLRDGLGRLSRSVFAAVETLEDLLKSRDDTIRLRAAGTLLSLGFRRMEIIDIEERLSELEGRYD